jgi:hypothetical protein
MNTSSRRRAAWALCGLLCASAFLCASFAAGGTSSARTYTLPTKPSYFCPADVAQLGLSWTRPMPYGGWLGTASASNMDNPVKVQIYDPQPADNGRTSWGFQAQDGSFVCRMYVTSDQNGVSFGNCRPSVDAWPLSSCVYY